MSARLGRLAGIALGLLLPLALAGPALAHSLQGRFASPLPLPVYLAGAAIAVGLSFAFVLVRDRPSPVPPLGPARPVPAWVRLGLRAVGLIAWLWILAQTILGGGGDADVASLFLWVYGWVGISLVSAFIGPAWTWLDPFTTLHDLGAGALRRMGVAGWSIAEYPVRLGAWPATLGYGFFVWLELAVLGATAGRTLGIVMLGYTAVTLAAMAQFGRDEWRAQGETFSVWFGTLGRLAPFALDHDDAVGRHVRRQPFGAGFELGWTAPLVVLVSLGTAGIIYDGMSQTQVFFDLFGVPSLPEATIILIAFLGAVAGAVLLVSRVAGLPALGAGLLPIAVGYLIAHYLTFLVSDGQRIVIAISDPFQQGWDLLGTAFFQPSIGWLPSGLLWTIQLVSVIGGHMVGAWAGHQAALLAEPVNEPVVEAQRTVRQRQVPLAALMVVLTVLTLWSLGQNIVQAPSAPPSGGTTPATGVLPATAPPR
jgi:hypothetical protein